LFSKSKENNRPPSINVLLFNLTSAVTSTMVIDENNHRVQPKQNFESGSIRFLTMCRISHFWKSVGFRRIRIGDLESVTSLDNGTDALPESDRGYVDSSCDFSHC